MAGIIVRDFRPSALTRESTPWGREVEQRIIELEKASSRSSDSEANANKSQNSQLTLISQKIVDLNQRVQDAVNNITIDASQVTSGVLATARVPNLDQSKITGTWDKPVNTSGDLVAASVNARLLGKDITTVITDARVASWGRTSDGFIATASSSRKFKTDIEPADWPQEKLEAVMGMQLIYYRWLAAVKKQEYLDTLEEGDPRFGENVPNHLELGFIAEEMHAAGLWEFVVYKRRSDDSLILKNGQPIPVSIHYTLWNLALHAVVQHLWAQRKQDRHDIDRLLQAAGLGPSE